MPPRRPSTIQVTGALMSILRKIGGRDALPVWTLPFAAGVWMTADKLARILAGRWLFEDIELTAFKLDANGVPVKLSPKQWDRVIEELELLQGRLKAMDCDEAEQIEQWRTESVKRLPADAFVWLDEGAAWFRRHQLHRDYIVFHEDGHEEIPQRPGDRDLDLSPLIPRVIEDYFRANDHREAGHPPPSVSKTPRTEPERLPVWQKWRFFDAAALAEKPELTRKDVRDLLGLEKDEYFWHGDDCEFDEAGIRAKPLDEAAKRLLSGTELRVREQFEEDIKLDLPCPPQTFLAWCSDNDFLNILPSAFMTAMTNRSRSFGIAAKWDDYERALLQDSWTAREALCWLHGRNPLWFRGDIERELPEQVGLVKRAAAVGRLNLTATPPLQWIEWAQEKGWSIPAVLLSYARLKRTGGNAPHPRLRYPQDREIYLTIAELRKRWRLSNNSFLEDLAGRKELLPCKNGEPVYVQRKGMRFEFGIPPDPGQHDRNESNSKSRFRSHDASLVTWVSFLPEDVLYPLPFVREYEDDVNPGLKPQDESTLPELATSTTDLSRNGLEGEPNSLLSQSEPEGANAALGLATRQRMAEMGRLRQVEAAVVAEWWEPFIKEAKEVYPTVGSKLRAAEIVAQRHPEANIKPGTLRQKF